MGSLPGTSGCRRGFSCLFTLELCGRGVALPLEGAILLLLRGVFDLRGEPRVCGETLEDRILVSACRLASLNGIEQYVPPRFDPSGAAFECRPHLQKALSIKESALHSKSMLVPGRSHGKDPEIQRALPACLHVALHGSSWRSEGINGLAFRLWQVRSRGVTGERLDRAREMVGVGLPAMFHGGHRVKPGA